MSFISKTEGQGYAPGYFLAHEECVRETREISDENAVTADNGGKYVPMGTPYPEAGANAEGLLYEDVDVTYGNMPGSVVTQGIVYENRISDELLTSATKTALEGKGFKFVTDDTVTRPY